MGAPKNNEYWKLRSKHGRKKIFETPEILWDAAVEYFETTSKRKWKKQDFIKAGQTAGTKIDTDIDTPFTLKGLCLFLGVNSAYFFDFEQGLKRDKDAQINKEFSDVVTRIRDIIEVNQVEGAMNGQFNSNLTARLNGIKDQTDITSNNKEIKGISAIIYETPEE